MPISAADAVRADSTSADLARRHRRGHDLVVGGQRSAVEGGGSSYGPTEVHSSRRLGGRNPREMLDQLAALAVAVPVRESFGAEAVAGAILNLARGRHPERVEHGAG
jgi:hypothetical protein